MSALKGWERLVLGVILILGFWLRFQNLGDIEFNIDQIYPVWQAINTLDTGELPLAGQGTSVLFANPTLTGYILLPFLALDRIPLMAYLVTITLNSMGIWFVYRAGRWLIGPHGALITTLLFAINPWIIEDSRRTWVQSLMPFFITLIFWALTPILTQQTRHPQRRLWITMVAATIFANTYLLAYFITLPIGLLILIFWRHIPKRSLLLGSVVFMMLFGLYAIGLLNDWENTQRSTEAFLEGESRLSSEALTHALRLITGWEYATARGVNAPADDALLRNRLSNGVHIIGLFFLLLGIAKAVYLLRQPSPSQGRRVALILLLWFGVPIVMMSYVSRQVHPFYLMFTVPAGYMLVAWGILTLVELLRPFPIPQRSFATAVAGMLIFAAGLHSLNVIRFAQETRANPSEHLPYNFPLKEAIASGRYINENYPRGTVFFTPTDIWTPMAFSGIIMPVEQSLVLQDTPIQTATRAMLITAEPSTHLMISYADQPTNIPVVGTPLAPPLILEDDTQLQLWRVSSADIKPPLVADIPSEEGIRFIGWAWVDDLAPSDHVRLNTYWRIDTLFPERGIWNYAPYAHLYKVQKPLQTDGWQLSGREHRLYIADGVVLPALAWQVGDVMVHQLVIEVPDEIHGRLMVRVGMYDSVRADNAIFYYPTATETVFTADLTILGAE